MADCKVKIKTSSRIKITIKSLFQVRLVNWTLAMLIVSEAVMILIGPAIIPKHLYLGWYLPEQSVKNTERFLDDRNKNLVWDDITGWRNRPNVSRRNWIIDGHGSRSTHLITLEKQKEYRVLFHGSSMVNGTNIVDADHTISAAIEDDRIEALNFGTMLYGLDQVFLDYTNRLLKYNPDLLVIGLSEHPGDTLITRYVPFHRRQEVNMPYMKPRFILDGGQLNLLNVPTRTRNRTILTDDSVIEQLSKTDGHYGNFEQFQRFGLLPLSNMARAFSVRLTNLYNLVCGEQEEMDLVLTLMNHFIEHANQNNTKVIFMILPHRSTTFPGGWRVYLPDHYDKMIGKMKAEGFEVLDGRQVLRDSGLSADQLYSEDQQHLRAKANHVMGSNLKKVITRIQLASATDDLPKTTSLGVR